MATWDDVKGFIRSKYKLKEDEGDFFSLVFDFSDSRSQLVFIQKFTIKNGSVCWAQISSPVGIIPQNNINKALEMLNDKVCGGLVKIGEKHFVRHCMPIADLAAEELTDPLGFVTASADELEKAFVGGDAQ